MTPVEIPRPMEGYQLEADVHRDDPRYPEGVVSVVRFDYVMDDQGDQHWLDHQGYPPSAYKVLAAYRRRLPPVKNPRWHQDTPADQVVGLTMAVQGMLGNLKNGYTPPERAIPYMEKYLQEIQDLVPFLRGEGEW